MDPIATKELVPDEKNAMNVAMLLSCGSFEGFFGWVQGQSRQSYLESYRNDWAWYYARGLLENGINPTLYIPALFETGKYETDVGVSVRFLPLSRWYRPFEQVWLKRLSRRSTLVLVRRRAHEYDGLHGVSSRSAHSG